MLRVLLCCKYVKGEEDKIDSMGNHNSIPNVATTKTISSQPTSLSLKSNGDKNGSKTTKSNGSNSQGQQPQTQTNFHHHEMAPIEALARILAQKSMETESVHAITLRCVTRHVFPRQPDLSKRLFRWMLTCAEFEDPERRDMMPIGTFKQQAERICALMSQEQQTEAYIKIYGEGNEISREGFEALCICAFGITLEYHPEGPQPFCPRLSDTLQSLVESTFHNKQIINGQYLVHWIENHCPRLVVPIHKLVVHQLSTSYRTACGPEDQHLELTTPVLERDSPWDAINDSNLSSQHDYDNLPSHGQTARVNDLELPVSQVWLLATILPQLYLKPNAPSPPLITANGLSSQALIARMLGTLCPSHWTQLYDSNHHGLGSNRFLHHVLSYRGPTLTFIHGASGVEFCIASSHEWRESHQYVGDSDCFLFQMRPQYSKVENSDKLLFLNTSIRGHPKGLQVGSNPREPSLKIDSDFEIVNFKGIPYSLLSVQVWGCGSTRNREVQLELKRWEVKEAERNKTVKLNPSDWLDHPDRYLLELAGRQSYTNKNS